MKTVTLEDKDGNPVRVELLRGATTGKMMFSEKRYVWPPKGIYGMSLATALELGYARIPKEKK